MTRLLVLAGGMGTRLRSVLADVPKPLAPINGTPFLHFLMRHWRAQGIRDMVFLLRHQADMMEEFLKQEQQQDYMHHCAVSTVTEPEALGTGGALAFAVRTKNIAGGFLATNADTWLGSGIAELLKKPAPAIAVVEVANTERYGSIIIEGETITAFKEKYSSHGKGWVNAGLYHLHSTLFDGWDGKPFSLEQTVFPPLAQSGQLHAAQLHTNFIDIGIPEDYFRFCRWNELGTPCLP
jgi:NDP-sugar pyrophosphorylase family protein